MIIKSYEQSRINLKLINFFLLYGKNDGLKKELSSALIDRKNNIFNYDEKEILDNPNVFLENAFSTSLFDDEKIIIIKRASDKILKILEDIINKGLKGLKIIIESNNLDKKSKLRSYFEKSKICACIAFYPDNQQTLSRLTLNFLREKKIMISNLDINLIVNKLNGDRDNLKNELSKIEAYCLSNKKITSEEIAKLTNLSEDHSIAELTDNCLAKNKKKIIKILNENSFSQEDAIIIIRTLINKSKKILNLSRKFESNNDLELTISSAKPPIFWKDKEITKKQIQNWNSKKVKQLIYALSETELQSKKNINNAINLITDFILNKFSAENNI